MQPNQQANDQCHVCQHLGEKQCKYSSHKKYRNQRGNQSFRVGPLVDSTHSDKFSYLKNIQQHKIEFEFPSLIPPSRQLSAQNIELSPNTVFQRTLIEKVLEDTTPNKTGGDSLAQQENNRTNKILTSEVRQFNLEPSKQFFKRPASFIRQSHQSSNHKLISSNAKKPQQYLTSTYSTIEVQQKPQKSFPGIDVKISKYHFDYNRKELPSIQEKSFLVNDSLRMRTMTNSNPQNSFQVDEPKAFAGSPQMLISRAQEDQNSLKNIFSKATIHNEDNQKKQTYGQKIQFKDEKYEIQKYSNPSYTNFLSQGQFEGIKIGENLIQKKEPHIQINTMGNSSFMVRQHQNSFYSKQSLQTQPQYFKSKVAEYSESQAFKPQQKIRASTRQKRFYPIYPVYEVVYQLVRVVPKI